MQGTEQWVLRMRVVGEMGDEAKRYKLPVIK